MLEFSQPVDEAFSKHERLKHSSATVRLDEVNKCYSVLDAVSFHQVKF